MHAYGLSHGSTLRLRVRQIRPPPRKGTRLRAELIMLGVGLAGRLEAQARWMGGSFGRVHLSRDCGTERRSSHRHISDDLVHDALAIALNKAKELTCNFG